jgi:hypothetical protein
MLNPEKTNMVVDALVRLVNAAAGYLESRTAEPAAGSPGRGRPAGAKNKTTPEAGAPTAAVAPDLSINTNANTGTVTPTPGQPAGAIGVLPNVAAVGTGLGLSAAAVQPSPPVGPTYDDVKGLVFKVAETKGRDVALSVLAKFGVQKGQDLKPEQYADAVKALSDALAVADVLA